MNKEEIWKDVVGYEGLYKVSNKGRLYSIKRKRKMNPTTSKNGYKRVKLYTNGKFKTVFVHRIVATAFLDNPENYPVVNHLDENKLNNNVENLQWCTQKQNVNHGTGQQRRTEAVKMLVKQYTLDGQYIATYKSAVDLQELYGFHQSAISRVCRGERKTAYKYIWKYAV